MNWTQLRLKLRKEFGNQFGFYNDKRSTTSKNIRYGSKRIKTIYIETRFKFKCE